MARFSWRIYNGSKRDGVTEWGLYHGDRQRPIARVRKRGGGYGWEWFEVGLDRPPASPFVTDGEAKAACLRAIRAERDAVAPALSNDACRP